MRKANHRHLAWVLEYLKSGGSITRFDAYYRIGCRHLAVCIREVRALGYKVNACYITHRDGRKSKQYSMEAA